MILLVKNIILFIIQNFHFLSVVGGAGAVPGSGVMCHSWSESEIIEFSALENYTK